MSDGSKNDFKNIFTIGMQSFKTIMRNSKNISYTASASCLQCVLLQQKWQQEHDTCGKPSIDGKQSAPASMDDRLERKRYFRKSCYYESLLYLVQCSKVKEYR